MDEDKQNNEVLPEDRFARFMFGEKREHRSQQQPTNNQSSIDYGTLLENIDILMESAQNLKPVFKKVYPFIEQLWKKK
ncbi:MAG: hypothetical protein AB2392_21175 [Neobacillus sp.]|jgi:hypothetical protein